MAGPKAVTQYEAVRAKVEQGQSVGEALKAVAVEFDTTPGTVSTNYYRVARSQAGRQPPRQVRDGQELTTDELLQQAMEALTLLMQRAESQEKDLERLRRIERALIETET